MLSNAVDEMMCNNVQYTVNGNIEKISKDINLKFLVDYFLNNFNTPIFILHCVVLLSFSFSYEAKGGQKGKLPPPPPEDLIT